MNRYQNNYEKLKELSSTFVFDTETYGLKYDELTLKDISFSDGVNSFYFDKDNLDKEKLREVFLNSELIVGHNLIFDFTVMAKFFGRDFLFDISKKKLFDTKIVQYILDENSRAGLKYLSEKILGYKMIEYSEASVTLDKDKWIKYSIEDSEQTWKLYNHFKDKVKDNEVFERECSCILAVTDMQNNGFLVNINKFDEVKQKMEERLNKLNKNFLELFDNLGISTKTLFGNRIPIDLNSPKQLKEFCNNVLKINIPNTSVDTLKYYKDKHEFFKLLLDYRHIFKLYNSYIIPLREEHIQSDGKIHPYFNSTGTKTGRFSSSLPNMQQIPAFDEFGMRKLFISDSDYKIVCMDYAGQELRITSEITKERNMIDAFNNNKDLHLMTANNVFKLNIPDDALKTDHIDYKNFKERFITFRKKAKNINFGLIYGAGYKGISRLTGESELESKKILDNFFNFYKGVKERMNRNNIELYKNKEVQNIFGRKRRFKEIDNKAKRQAFNFLVQSSAADMLKIDLNRIWNEVILEYKDSIKLVATVHDEIIFMIKEGMTDEIIPKLVSIMQDFKFSVPIIVDYDVGNSYGDAH